MYSTWKQPVLHRCDQDFFAHFHYHASRVLGKGTYGEVLQATSIKPGRPDRALKRFPLRTADGQIDSKQFELFYTEATSTFNLQHRCLVNTYGGVLCPDFAYIAMDVYPKGDLMKNIPSLDLRQMCRYTVDIACAVHYLHRNRVLHHDIKANNIFLSEKNAFLADLGLTMPVADGKHTVNYRFGNTFFQAPEMKQDPLVPFCPFKVSVMSLLISLQCLPCPHM